MQDKWRFYVMVGRVFFPIQFYSLPRSQRRNVIDLLFFLVGGDHEKQGHTQPPPETGS